LSVEPFQQPWLGLGIGAIAAYFLTRLRRGELYGVPPYHLLTFVSAALVLLVPTLLASVLPAAKAASLNPGGSLRKD